MVGELFVPVTQGFLRDFQAIMAFWSGISQAPEMDGTCFTTVVVQCGGFKDITPGGESGQFVWRTEEFLSLYNEHESPKSPETMDFVREFTQIWIGVGLIAVSAEKNTILHWDGSTSTGHHLNGMDSNHYLLRFGCDN